MFGVEGGEHQANIDSSGRENVRPHYKSVILTNEYYCLLCTSSTNKRIISGIRKAVSPLRRALCSWDVCERCWPSSRALRASKPVATKP